MKRILLAVLAGAMLMGFASQAMAEITIGGDIEIRYALWQNIDLNNYAANFDTQNFFDQRVMLHVDAQIAEGLSAFVELDTENYDWGQETSAFNVPTYLNHQDPALEIRQAWINFMIPGLPVGMKIGHQPLALGHGIWLDTSRRGSDAILVYSMPIPELLIAGAYVQMSQSTPTTPRILNGNPAFGRMGPLSLAMVDSANTLVKLETAKDDADAYALLVNYTWMEGNTVGMNFTYVDDDASLEGLVDIGLPLHRDHITAYNTMLSFDGSIAGINYRGEADWLYINVDTFYGNSEDYIVSALAGMLGADYSVNDMLSVGMEVAYGTGNDGTSDSPNLFYSPGNAVFNTATNRHDNAYYTPYNSTSYDYAYLYNDKIGQGPQGTGGGYGFSDGFGGFGLANTSYIKLSVGVSPLEAMSAGMDVLVLNASEQLVKGQDQFLGVEIDAHMNYDIYDNLALELEGGYFIAGDWYEYGDIPKMVANSDLLKDPTDPNSAFKVDDAWGAEARLEVSF